MGFADTMFGGSKTPSYLKDLNKHGAQFQKDQMNANRDNWDNALNYSQMGADTDIGYNTATGGFLNSNPYIDQVVNNTTNQIMDKYNNSYIPQAMSDFAGSGRYGSGLMQENMKNMQKQLNQDIGNAANNIYSNNYNQERSYMENAQNRLGQQYDMLNRNAQYSNILNGGQANVNTNYQDNKMGLLEQIGGISNAVGSTAGAIGGLMALSDERSKENIEKVGRLDNGLKVYKYNYKGDNKTQIGLIAQEVQEKNPEAVGKIGIGDWLGVNYDLATERAA